MQHAYITPENSDLYGYNPPFAQGGSSDGNSFVHDQSVPAEYYGHPHPPTPHLHGTSLSHLAVDPQHFDQSLYAYPTFDPYSAHDDDPFIDPEHFYQTTDRSLHNGIPQNDPFCPSSRNREFTHPDVFQIPYNAAPSFLAAPLSHHHTIPSGDYMFDQPGPQQNFRLHPVPPPAVNSRFFPPSSMVPAPSSQPLHHLPPQSFGTALPHSSAHIPTSGPQSLTNEDRAIAYRRARQDDERKGRLTGSHRERETGRLGDYALVHRENTHTYKQDKQAENDFMWGRNDGFVYEDPGKDYVHVLSRE